MYYLIVQKCIRTVCCPNFTNVTLYICVHKCIVKILLEWDDSSCVFINVHILHADICKIPPPHL